MADPQLPGVIRVLCIQPSATGLGADAIVNSIAFEVAPTPAPIDTLIDHLATFFDTLDPNFRPLSLVTEQMEFRVYQLIDPPPREPDIHFRAVTESGIGSPLPEEVAICLTYHGARNLPRQRGRMYLGPWGVNALSAEEGHARVGSATRGAIITAFDTLFTAAAADGYVFGIVSPTTSSFITAQGGWVDNSFDTIRKRGPEPTSRLSYVLPAV